MFFQYNQQIKMKKQVNFRIVYLKNDEKRKYLDDRLRANSIVTTSTGVVNPALVPSLVHLSARLQEENGQIKSPMNKKNEVQSKQPIKKDLVKDELETIEKYINKKQLQLNKQKKTMKNLVGSIDFDIDRRKERKIARLIKATIQGDTRSKMRNKSIGEDINSSQNRSFLQSDFSNFLTKKREQFIRQKRVCNPQEIEEMKLKRLSMISIEKDISPTRAGRPLDLFFFQHSRSSDRLVQKVGTSKTGPRATRKAERKMNLHQSMKNDIEFDWSKLSRIPFNFRTVNP